MNQKTLLKNLAIGFLPLLIFIFADEFFGLTAGLIIAILFGIGELIFIYIRERRFDRFILFDTALIVALGMVSLLLQNDIFFKLKPGIVELILVVLIGVTAFSDHPILIQMTGRYMKGVELSSVQIQHMHAMMRKMFWIFAAHTGLIFYAAIAMSTAAWGFISGGLLYILMGIVFATEFFRTRWQRKKLMTSLQKEEWFDVLSPEGEIIGKAPRSAVHGNPELLHAVVHVHIVNSQGELFLQKRASNKDLFPDRWDTAVGGHVSSGETIENALRREAEEELGITQANFQPLFRYIMKNKHESELVHAFLLMDDGPFKINKSEISDGQFWKIDAIEQQLGAGVFTPNFEEEFVMLKKLLWKSENKTPRQNRKSRRRRKR